MEILKKRKHISYDTGEEYLSSNFNNITNLTEEMIINEIGNYIKFCMEKHLFEKIYEKEETTKEKEYREKCREKVHYSKKILSPNLPELDVNYCKEFLRQSLGPYERDCNKGEKCIGNIMFLKFPDSYEQSKYTNKTSLILREFLLPEELENFRITGKLNSYVNTCLLCNRFETTFNYQKNISNKIESLECIQNHINKIDDKNGGYDKSKCIFPTPKSQMTGIIGPIIKFSLVDYNIEEVLLNDIKILKPNNNILDNNNKYNIFSSLNEEKIEVNIFNQNKIKIPKKIKIVKEINLNFQ